MADTDPLSLHRRVSSGNHQRPRSSRWLCAFVTGWCQKVDQTDIDRTEEVVIPGDVYVPNEDLVGQSSRQQSLSDAAVSEGHPGDTDFLLSSRYPDELLASSTDAISTELSRKAVAPIEPDTVEVSRQQDLEEKHDEKCHLPELLPQAATVLVPPLPLPPKEVVLVPAADETTEEQRRSLRLPSVSITHKKWVHPIPIHLAGKQEELEQRLAKVHELTKNEHLIAAHSEYLKLVQLMDNVLVDNHLQVFGLVRPPFYLRHLHDSYKDPEPQILQDVPQSNKLTRVGTAEFSRIWGASPSLTRAFPPALTGDPDWQRERSWLLSRRMSKRLEASEPFQEQKKTSKRLSAVSLEAAAHHFSSLGATILEEPVTALPLRSQQLNFINHDVAQPASSDPVQRVIDTCSGVPGDPESQKYLGRRLLRKRVWPLGDLPSIGFASQDKASDLATSSSVKSLLAEQARDVDQDPNMSTYDLKETYGYTYAKRTVAGLSLPVDIQVIFLLSSASPSTTGEDPGIVQRRQSSATSFPGAGIPPDGPSERMKKQGTDVATDAETRQLWKWFHYFLEKVINNPQIHRMRIQHYRTQLSLEILSTDLATDKSWSVSKTKEHRLAWKVMSDNNVMCMIEGTLNTPLFQCLSLVNEADLHKNWIPFLNDSGRIHQVATFSQLIRQHSALPWPLNDREALLFGYAVDCLGSTRPCVIMNGLSIPDPVTSCFGLPISSPKPGITRLLVKMFTFQLTPDREDPLKTKLKEIIFIDPQVSLIPKAVHGFIAKQTAVRLFNNIQNLSKGFRGSVYETRVQQNPQLYGMIQSRLDSFYRELPNAIPDPTITQNSDKKQEPKG